MRKFFLLSLLVCLTATFALAQTNTTESKDEIQAEGPVMTFESMVVEYGNIEQGSEPLRVASFTNTGTEPLIITNAKGSCGCTVPEWPKAPIMPGESSEIKIRYDTKRVGPINKTVKITSNDAAGTHVLRVQGKIAAAQKQESVPKKSSIFEKPNNNNN